MDYIQMASLRIGISTIALFPVLLVRWKKFEFDKITYVALSGLLGAGIPAYCYAFAQTHINSSVAGILNTLTPIFTFIIGILFFQSKFQSNKIIGLILGFLGAVLLIYQGDTEDSGNLNYAIFIVIGTMCYGFNANIIKRYFQHSDPILISAMSFLIVGIPAITYLIFSNTIPQILSADSARTSIAAIVTLSIMGTVIANILYIKLAQSTNAVFASSVAYIMPVIALMWGFFDNEVINLIQLVSFGVIIYGVYLIRK